MNTPAAVVPLRSRKSRLSASCAGLALCLPALVLAAGAAQALPYGGSVTAGAADFAGAPGALTVNQGSPNVIIDWQGFGVAPGESVTFVQPDAASVALNRVVGADPSAILGGLSANGRVFLVNPNGVLFGPGAQVNVGGLVASTLGIADADFLAGRYSFSGDGGAVLNQGSISADGGYVAMLGARVSNQGVISARLGSVALAAGQGVTLDVVGDGLLNVMVDSGALGALVENGGLIRADGGQVLMTAQSAGQLLRTVVNNTGVIEARSLGSRNGAITLLADAGGGLVSIGGRLDASGRAPGETGGSITLTAAHVGLFSAALDASGDVGGGAVRIGGGYQGRDASVTNAAATYMSADSIVSADAARSGGGGSVVLWGDSATRAYGVISVRGVSGGGMVETSGHFLDVVGVDIRAGASNGPNGAWLLDPADVTIGVGAVGGSFVNNVFAPDAGVSVATVDAGALQTALNGGANITITTTNVGAPGGGLGNITVLTPLVWTTGRSLTLNADNNIIVSAAMTASTQNAAMVFNAVNNVLINAAVTASGQNGRIQVNAGGNITATAAITATALNAVVDMTAGGNISVVALTADGGGVGPSVNLRADQNVVIGGALSAAGGGVVLRADSDGSGPGALAGTVSFTGPGAVTASSTTTIRFNPNGYANTQAEITSYAPRVTGVLDARAWVFPVGIDRPYDGTTDAGLQFRNIAPADNPNVGNIVTLVAGAADFDTKDVGVLKPITFTGYTLAGANVARFALFSDVGVAAGDGTTTGAVTPIALTVTADSHAAKQVGDTVTFTGAEFTSVGLVNAETIAQATLVSAGAPAGAGVGVYAITPSNALANGAFLPANYVITYIDGQLPVIAAPAPTPTSPTPPIPPTPTSPTPTNPTPTSPIPTAPGVTGGSTVTSGDDDSTTVAGETTADLLRRGGGGGDTAVGDTDTAVSVSSDAARPWLSVTGPGVRMPVQLVSTGRPAPAAPTPAASEAASPAAAPDELSAAPRPDLTGFGAPRIYAPKQDRH